MGNKINLGIYCPKWLLVRHNTDHKVVLEMDKLNKYSSIDTSLIASTIYTLSFNLNHYLRKLFKDQIEIIKHKASFSSFDPDIIYHYGEPKSQHSFYSLFSDLPIVITTGFMTDRHTISSFGYLVDRQKQADQLAKKIENANLIHFHTRNGKQRFLNYRPEFEEKIVSIPFFLPHLSLQPEGLKKDNANIVVLFVGYQGKLKGLDFFISTLDSFSEKYLKERGVKVIVVSEDKPHSKSNYDLEWYSKLSNNKILQLMNYADIFSFVSKRDSYGLVLIEAMANECAIIADDDLTRKEILADTGLCIPPDEMASFKNGLQELIDSEEKRKTLADKAKKRFTEVFSPKVVAQQYEEAFLKL